MNSYPLFKFHLLQKMLLFVLLILFEQKIHAQETEDSLWHHQQAVIKDFIQIKSEDKIADIGTGYGVSLIPIAAEYPDMIFTAEDISRKKCNKKILKKVIKFNKSKASVNQFDIVYGTDTSTNLPSASFTKVLMFDVLHEITFKNIMLADVKRILKSGGSVFVCDILVHKKIKKDKICNYPFLTEDELKTVMTENKFILQKEAIAYDKAENRYLKIFEYKPE